MTDAALFGALDSLSQRHRPDTSEAGVLASVALEALERTRRLLVEARDEIAKQEDQMGRLTRQRERSNEDLERFAYAVSHDLQAPLHTVRGFSELLADHLDSAEDENVQECVSFIQEGVERMRLLISEILTFSRVGRQGDATVLDGATVMTGVSSHLADDIRKQEAQVTVDALPAVRMREGDLRQLLIQLLDNALRFRDPQRPLEVRVWAQESEPDRWVWGVADTGIGLDPSKHREAFDMFRRCHPEHSDGAGAGLAICRKVVEHYGGTIWMDSTPGVGTRVFFTLPTITADDAVGEVP